MSETVSKEQMDAAMRAAFAAPRPDVILVDPRKLAMLNAARDFAGHDWRRIKREMNKAWKRAGK